MCANIVERQKIIFMNIIWGGGGNLNIGCYSCDKLVTLFTISINASIYLQKKYFCDLAIQINNFQKNEIYLH